MYEEDGDCDDRNPAVYPGAQDLPYDGVDSNCNGYQEWGETILGVRLDGYGDPLGVRVGQLEDVAVGPEGEVYFSDSELCLIRKVQDGAVTTVAGTGVCGSTGEVGMGVGVEVEPEILAFDDVRGRLYFLETKRHRIRYLDLETGLVHLFAGTGATGTPVEGEPTNLAALCYPGALDVDASTGSVFFGNAPIPDLGCTAGVWKSSNISGTDYFFKVQGNGECNSPAMGSSALESDVCPGGLASAPFAETAWLTTYSLFDGGDSLWRLSNISAAEPSITHVAGDFERSCDPPSTTTPLGTSLCEPRQPTLSPDGALYIPQFGGTVLRYDPENPKLEWTAGQGIPRGELEPVAQRGDSEAKSAPLGALTGIDWDGTDEGFFLADQGTGLVRWLKLNHAEPGVHWVFDYAGLQDRGYGEGAVESVQLDGPYGLDVWVDPETDEEVIYITDIENGVLLEVKNGLVQRIAGQFAADVSAGDGGPAIDATLITPRAIDVAPNGDIYFTEHNRIRRIRDGLIETIAGDGDSGFSADGTLAGEAQLNSPRELKISEDGSSLYFAERSAHRLRMIPLVDGEPQALVTVIGGGEQPLSQGVSALDVDLPAPLSLWLDGDYIYITLDSEGSVVRLTPEGTLDIVASIEGQHGAGEGEVTFLPDMPKAVALDPWGVIYVQCVNNLLYQLRDGVAIRVMGVPDVTTYLQDDGPASELAASSTASLDFNPSGDLFYPSSADSVVRILRF